MKVEAIIVLCALSVVGAFEIHHIEYNGRQLIDVINKNNYAVITPELIKEGFVGAFVKNGTAIGVKSTCINEKILPQTEVRQKLISSIDLPKVHGDEFAFFTYYNIPGTMYLLSFGDKWSSIVREKVSIELKYDGTFTGRGPLLPDEIKLVLVNRNAVAFVTSDSEVVLKARKCLDYHENLLVRTLELLAVNDSPTLSKILFEQ